MHQLNVASIKFFRLIVPLAQKVLTPKQPKPPSPDATTYIPSPSNFAQTLPGSKRSTVASDAKLSQSASESTAGPQQRLLKTDIYLPTQTADIGLSPLPPNAVLPIVINFHGSGFCFQAHGEDAAFCSYLANSLPAVVIDIDYSHAPEHPFPAAIEDVDAAIRWAKRFARIGRKCRQKFGLISGVGGGGDNEWEWDEKRVALTGFSAGGNLALVGSTRREENGGVKAVVAFYPSTNLAESAWDKPQLAPGSGAAGGALPPWLRYMLYQCYIPVHVAPDRTDPSISPLYASPASFPSSVTIINCEKDSLARQASQLADRLKASAVSTTSHQTLQTSAENQPSFDLRTTTTTTTTDFAEASRADRFAGDIVLWTAKQQGHNWDKMAAQGSEPAAMRDEAYRLTVKRIRDAFAKVAIGLDDLRDDEDEERDKQQDGTTPSV